MPETTEPAATTPKTWPADAFPPAKELADWLWRCTAAEREQFATQAVQDAETAHTCRVAWHREQLAAMLVDSAGKVVVLRGHEDWAESVDVHEAVQPFLDAGAVSVLVLVPGASIDALDEEQMRAAGWVKEQAAKEFAEDVVALYVDVLDPDGPRPRSDFREAHWKVAHNAAVFLGREPTPEMSRAGSDAR